MGKESIKFVKNLSESSQKGYSSTVLMYENFHNASIDELVEEALKEQSNKVPQHELKIITRIEDFQRSLVESNQNYCRSTIVLYMSRIKTIYKKNRVVLPYLEPLRPTEGYKREYVEYKDIITKNEISHALSEMNPTTKARVLTMAQGGFSNEECEHFTTRQFIDELYPYHQQDDDIKALRWLSDEKNPVIWITKLIRVKTHKPYYGLIHPESINHIAKAKLYEMRLPKYDFKIPQKLFPQSKRAFRDNLRIINNKLNYGNVNGEFKMRPHMLRKFNASNINGSALTYEEHSLSNYEIDEMQGRGKTSVQDTYIKTNPLKQKLLYAKVMNNMSFYNQYEYHIIGNDIVLTISNPDMERIKMEEKIRKLEKQVEQKEIVSQRIKELREELGEANFDEIIAGILNAK